VRVRRCRAKFDAVAKRTQIAFSEKLKWIWLRIPVYRRLRTPKGGAIEDLAVTFGILQRIEKWASRLQEAAAQP
jgi:hypothetical protein